MAGAPVPSPEEAPTRAADYPVWAVDRGSLHVRFVGRGDADRSRDETLARVEPAAPPVAALHQVHSSHVLEVQGPGSHGDADALVTGAAGVALSVITADCVPVLLAAGERVAAVHAGWRGIVGGIVPAAVAALRAAGPVSAWIGPAIGPCCYEVGEEVAERVAAASTAEAVLSRPGGRPHLDLLRAARHQLLQAGVTEVDALSLCTRDETELLSSYRREGKGGGRNLAFIWRRGCP